MQTVGRVQLPTQLSFCHRDRANTTLCRWTRPSQKAYLGISTILLGWEPMVPALLSNQPFTGQMTREHAAIQCLSQYLAAVIWFPKFNKPLAFAALWFCLITILCSFCVRQRNGPSHFWHHNEQCNSHGCRNWAMPEPAPSSAAFLAAWGVQSHTKKAKPQKQPAGFRLPSSRNHEVKSLLCHWCGSNTFPSVHPSRTIPKYFAKSFFP